MMVRAVDMLTAVLIVALLIYGAAAGAQTLDFAQAREMTLREHPGLKALAEELAAAQAGVRQASAYSNPEIEVETENFGQNEVEVVLTQPIGIGGRRGAAIAKAERGAAIVELRLESERLSVEAELIRRFAPVLSVQRKLALLDSLLAVSARGIEAVQRLVEAGATMEIDLVRAELEEDELILERAELERNMMEAKVGLGELWGDTAPGFDGVRSSLPGTFEIPTLQELKTVMEHHPESRLLEAQRLLIEAEIDEARAEGTPELALSGGYLRNNELDEEALIAGISLSLPIFNRNKGAVAQKRREMAAAGHEARGNRLERAASLATLYSEIEGTRRELQALSGDLLLKATHIHDALVEFYMHGKTGILDVLEARGHLIELRMRIVDLLEEHALLAADLQDLTGYQLEIFE